jgi:hypothetical protein
MGWGSMDLIDLAGDRDLFWVLWETSNEPSGSIKCREKFLSSWATGGLSRRVQLHAVSCTNNCNKLWVGVRGWIISVESDVTISFISLLPPIPHSNVSKHCFRRTVAMVSTRRLLDHNFHSQTRHSDWGRTRLLSSATFGKFRENLRVLFVRGALLLCCVWL